MVTREDLEQRTELAAGSNDLAALLDRLREKVVGGQEVPSVRQMSYNLRANGGVFQDALFDEQLGFVDGGNRDPGRLFLGEVASLRQDDNARGRVCRGSLQTIRLLERLPKQDRGVVQDIALGEGNLPGQLFKHTHDSPSRPETASESLPRPAPV